MTPPSRSCARPPGSPAHDPGGTMTTTIDRPSGPKGGEAAAAPAVAPRPTRPVVLTAGFGAVMLIFSLVVWARWVASDRFRPIHAGPDKIATFRLWLLYGLQAGGFAL